MDLFGNLFYIIKDMKKYDLYLFDFDGTLLDTMPALTYVFSVSYEHIGVHFNPEDTMEFSRIPLDEGFRKINGNPDKWKDFCDYIEASLDFPEALERNYPYPESMEFFRYLKEHNIKAGIVTSNKAKHVKEVLHKMNIPADTFSVIMGSKQYKNFKPHPEPILKALEEIKHKGELKNIVYVGDGINDTLCANNAGVDAVLVDRIDAFKESDKYIKIKSLMELFENED